MAKEDLIPFPTRTARFRQVVERCGRPEVYLAFVDPGRDRVLQGLKRRGQVMTIRRASRGAGTDFGMVGVFAERGAQFLVFDRSLKAFTGRRIVGIDYSLLEARAKMGGQAAPRTSSKRLRPAKRSDRPRAAAPEGVTPIAPPPDPPPGLAEIRSELGRMQRLLAAKRHASAKGLVDRLVERLKTASD